MLVLPMVHSKVAKTDEMMDEQMGELMDERMVSGMASTMMMDDPTAYLMVQKSQLDPASFLSSFLDSSFFPPLSFFHHSFGPNPNDDSQRIQNRVD